MSALLTIRNLNESKSETKPHDSRRGNDYQSSRDIRESLFKEIRRLKKRALRETNKPRSYEHTPVYHSVLQLIREGSILKGDDLLWGEVATTIREDTPDFEDTLKRLSLNQLNERESKVLLLIRLGFTSSQISKLEGRVKSTLTYRRRKMADKLFHGEVSIEEFDRIIRII